MLHIPKLFKIFCKSVDEVIGYKIGSWENEKVTIDITKKFFKSEKRKSVYSIVITSNFLFKKHIHNHCKRATHPGKNFRM